MASQQQTAMRPPQPRRWDPSVLQLLRGALLSNSSPLRILRFDGDALRLVVATFRSARARHLDWTQHGFWPDLAHIDFPPPLVKGRDIERYYGVRSTSILPAYRERPMLPDADIFDNWSIEGVSSDIRSDMNGLWNGLKKWAVDKGLYDPLEVEEDTVTAANDQMRDFDRQALIQSLRDLVEPFHVKMLPIVMGSHASLPDKCKRYSSIINLCLQHCPDEEDAVGYLTIQEGYVEPGASQRRPGLHIESPGYYKIDEDGIDDSGELKQLVHRWGYGIGPAVWQIKGGIFQASSIPDTCRVWDCIVHDHGEIVGTLGNLEHLRHNLDSGPPRGVIAVVPEAPRNEEDFPLSHSSQPPAHRNGQNMAACRVAWMTDRTPHESLPVQRRVFRQYFRLVTSQVTAWYEAHSTRNDECNIVPPDYVDIIRGDKFRAAGVDNQGGPDAPAEFL
ncbi:hypothetical protein HK405_005063 [Cladochytrium tenue]|nr:hypothetical protein HK405_005063 [Cladochytrium tenue]